MAILLSGLYTGFALQLKFANMLILSLYLFAHENQKL